MSVSTAFARHGDKQHSPFSGDCLQRLLEARDRSDRIDRIAAVMMMVDPGMPDMSRLLPPFRSAASG